MTLRVFNVDKWRRFKGGDVIELPGLEAEQRVVRVEFNTAALTKVYLVEPGSGEVDDSAVFLGAVTGRDAVEFSVSGHAFLAAVSDDEVWFHTDDVGERPVDLGEAYSFAKLLERKARNPELELMMFIARRNEARRDAQQAEERAAMRAEFAAQLAALQAKTQSGESDAGVEAETGRSVGTSDGAPEGEPEAQARSAKPAAKGKAGATPG